MPISVAYGDLVFENAEDLKRLYNSKKAISFLVDEVVDPKCHYRYKDRHEIHPWEKEAEVVVKNNNGNLERMGKAIQVRKQEGEQEYGEFAGVVRFTKFGLSVLESYLRDDKVQWEKKYLTSVLQAMIDNKEHHHLFDPITMDGKY